MLTSRAQSNGYAVERALEDYPDWGCDDLAPWGYHPLPTALGCTVTAKVRTDRELEAAMQQAEAADIAAYIEVLEFEDLVRAKCEEATS